MYKNSRTPQIQAITAEDIEKLQSGEKKMPGLQVGVQNQQGTPGRYHPGYRPPRRMIRGY